MKATAPDVDICPYLQSAPAEPGRGAAYAAYCRRPEGAVRVPSLDERERFCVTGHHRDCPGYRGMVLDGMLASAQS